MAATNKKNHVAMHFLFLFLQIAAISTAFRLSTNSRWIVDHASGKRVKLTCVNWPSHMEPMIAEGLEKKPVKYIVKQIAATGFNCVRFTWPTYMFTRPDYGTLTVAESLDKYNLSAAKDGIGRNNPEFLKMKVIQVHMEVVSELGRGKIMVVLDNHVSHPTWCCKTTDGNGFFGDEYFSPDEWLKGLAAVATAYKDNPAVVGMSLRNELRGERQNEDDWYKYMQQGAETVHKQSPRFLVIVSGLNSETNLAFLKSKPFTVDLHNKLVFEAHWYSFGDPAEKWAAQTNHMCAQVTQKARNNYLFLTANGNNSFPLFFSEFGVDHSGAHEPDKWYIGCFMAAVAEADADWALWSLQGSYIFREGIADHGEAYGVLDFNWDRPRNPAFLHRLQLLREINQDNKSKHPMHYKIFHPLSGQCVQIEKGTASFANCKLASWWDHHDDGGALKLTDGSRCLGVAGDGSSARVSDDCSSKWKFVSSSGLHLAAQDGNGKYLCLERHSSDLELLTKKCLCVGEDLVDTPSCSDNPQAQWFKLVPANV